MLFRKLSPEELLSKFTLAQKDYFAQKEILENMERYFEEVRKSYYMYKHYYEFALAEYARFGGRIYSEKEIEARHKYAIASKNYNLEQNRLSFQQCKFKKAHKLYKRLRKLLDKTEEKNSQPQ